MTGRTSTGLSGVLDDDGGQVIRLDGAVGEAGDRLIHAGDDLRFVQSPRR